MQYEAYIPLAIKTLTRLAEEVRQLIKSPNSSLSLQNDAKVESGVSSQIALNVPRLLRIVVAHRLGEVPAKEASIFIGVSSPHRKEAFVACEWLLESIKRDAQIWKKEWYEDDLLHPHLGPDGSLPNATWKENFKPIVRP